MNWRGLCRLPESLRCSRSSNFIKKLKLHRTGSSSLAWFESYLSERKQFVTIGSKNSSSLQVGHGVPQGSILGPVLFLFFVNDIHLHCSNSSIDILADDTTLSYNANWKDIASLSEKIKSDLNNLKKWSVRNRIFINTEKTKAMLVKGKRLKKKLVPDQPQFEVCLNGTRVDEVSSHKLLGVIIDTNLNFNDHIDNLCKKLSKRIGLLRHICKYLKKEQREIYYNGVVKPVLMYGSTIWSNSNKENMPRLFKIQKRAARSILMADRDTRSITLFNALNWIPFSKEIDIRRCALDFKRLNNKTSVYINDLLPRNSEIHDRQNRFPKLNLYCPRFNRITEGGRTFSVRTIKDWNNIDIKIRTAPSVYSFKRNLFNQFLSDQKVASRLYL